MTQFVVYRIALVFYRLYFHPLAGIPGPKIHAISWLPYLYKDRWKGTWMQSEDVHLHERYGPIVRITPDGVAVDPAISAAQVLARPVSKGPEFRKIPAFYAMAKAVGIVAAPRDQHRAFRRVLNPVFNEGGLRDQEVVIRSYVDVLLQRIRDASAKGQNIDVVKWFNFLTFDIIGDMAFGESFGALDTEGYHPWNELLLSTPRMFGYFLIAKRIPVLSPLLWWITRKDVKQVHDHHVMSAHKIDKRVNLGAHARKDFLTNIIANNNDKELVLALSREDMTGLSETFIFAGGETTATCLSGLFFYLTRPENAHVYRILADEVRSAFKSPAEITMLSTLALPYVHGCIEEALRLYPPGTEVPPRMSPGAEVAGHHIPEGYWCHTFLIAGNVWSKYWADPQRFAPERWLPAAHPLHSSRYDGDNHAVFRPFSAGPRDCIGKNMAYAELRLVVALIAWHFDIESVPGQDDWKAKQLVFTGWHKAPLWLRLRYVAHDA